MQIREHLIQRAPSDAGFQEELALAYSAIGDLYMAQKNWAEALAQYIQCRAALQQLATKETPNLSWRRMLAQSTQTVADLLMAQNKPADALGIYRQSLEIRRALFNQDKRNVVWQRDLGATLYLTAECLKKLGGDDNLGQSRDCLQEALSIATDYHGADQAQVLDVLRPCRALVPPRRRRREQLGRDELPLVRAIVKHLDRSERTASGRCCLSFPGCQM